MAPIFRQSRVNAAHEVLRHAIIDFAFSIQRPDVPPADVLTPTRFLRLLRARAGRASRALTQVRKSPFPRSFRRHAPPL